MSSIYTIPAIIGMTASCFGIGWGVYTFIIYPYLMNKPKLFVELVKANEGFTQSQTLLQRIQKDGTVSLGADEDWYLYQFDWFFDLIINNDSEFNAYNLRLLQNKQQQLHFKDKINFNRALKSQNDLTLSFRVSIIVEIQGKERENYWENNPRLFNDLNILLEYKNPKGKLFYSNFDFSTQKTTFREFNKKEIISNWMILK